MTESETHLPFDEEVRRIFRYTWRLTSPPQDGRQTRQTDLCGWDGDIPIGRIFLLPEGCTKGCGYGTDQGSASNPGCSLHRDMSEPRAKLRRGLKIIMIG